MQPTQRASRQAAIIGTMTLFVPIAVAWAENGQAAWMSEVAIRAAFSGVTLEGKYGSGKPFTETYEKDGRIAYREGGMSIAGKWSVEAGTFCTIYDSDPTGGCYRVRQVGGNCYEFYFVARTEDQAKAEPRDPSWTARGSIVGQTGSCAEQHNV